MPDMVDIAPLRYNPKCVVRIALQSTELGNILLHMKHFYSNQTCDDGMINLVCHLILDIFSYISTLIYIEICVFIQFSSVCIRAAWFSLFIWCIRFNFFHRFSMH